LTSNAQSSGPFADRPILSTSIPSRSFALYVAFDFFSGIFAVFYREREVM
jgi:hypothetical protein